MHSDLQFHHIATGRCSDANISVAVKKTRVEETQGTREVQACADVDVVFGERADVPGSLVMVDDFFVVEAGQRGCLADGSQCTGDGRAKHCCVE